MAAAPPTGTVTFLRAAVDDANACWKDGSDAIAVAVERHESILRDATAQHGGYVFATSDDGLTAAFPTAVDAAEAAVEMQQRMLAEHDRLGSDVRIGMHTGEASDGTSNYAG